MTKNQPELKACPWCGSHPKHTHTKEFNNHYYGCSNVMCPVNPCSQNPCATEREAALLWNTSPSPIIPEDAYPKPVDEKTVPEEFDKIIADAAYHWQFIQMHGLEEQYHRWISGADLDIDKPISETIKAIRMSMQYGCKLSPIDIETLITHALKGQSK